MAIGAGDAGGLPAPERHDDILDVLKAEAIRLAEEGKWFTAAKALGLNGLAEGGLNSRFVAEVLRGELGRLPIHVPSVADLHHGHDPDGVIDLVEDA